MLDAKEMRGAPLFVLSGEARVVKLCSEDSHSTKQTKSESYKKWLAQGDRHERRKAYWKERYRKQVLSPQGREERKAQQRDYYARSSAKILARARANKQRKKDEQAARTDLP